RPVGGVGEQRESGVEVEAGGNDHDQGPGRLAPLRPQALPLPVVGTGLPLFTDPTYRPLIVTGAAAADDRRRRLQDVAEVITVGDDGVDLGAAIGELGRRGHRVLLAEGGPSLNSQLIADDLVDEWNLSISPLLAAGPSARPAQGRLDVGPPRPMTLARVWMSDDLLFCRWVRSAARRA
ncbi:MAG: dihydrofolate reductase family protein, partial [Actinomycetota bacterium]